MSRPFLEGYKDLPVMRVRQAHRDNNRDIGSTGQELGLFQCISIYIEPSRSRAGTSCNVLYSERYSRVPSGQRSTLQPSIACSLSGLFNVSHVAYGLDRCRILTLKPRQPQRSASF
jgi:hypothetical protein